MTRLKILICVLVLVSLSACASSASRQGSVVKAALPPWPNDLKRCARGPVILKGTRLNAGQIEKLWKKDRARLLKAGRCLKRAEQFYENARENLEDVFGG